MTAKEKYRKLCEEDPTIPIFSKDWWMDAVCGEDNWDVLFIEKNGQVVAAMPLYFKGKLGLKYITVPRLTQTQGVHIRYPNNQKYEARLSFEKQVMKELIDALEETGVVFFQQNFHYTMTNWQPFYWRGFQQTTYYTSVIDDLSDLSKVFANFSKSARKDIRRAERAAIVFVTEDIEKFCELNEMVFKRQGITSSYDASLIRRIDDACKKHDCRVMIAAKDDQGEIHSIVYLVWDRQSAYLLMSGTNPDFRTSDFKTLLVWEAIKFSSNVTRKFDFEGSMNEQIADYFRKFGAILTPYHSISKAFRYKKLIQLYKLWGDIQFLVES